MRKAIGRHTALFIIVSLVLFSLLILPSWASGPKAPLPPTSSPQLENYFSIMSQITFTPVATIYLPLVMGLPPEPDSHGVIGTITFHEARNTYAVGEKVYVDIEVTNTSTETMQFGIIGLNTSTGGFQTSWSNGTIASGDTFRYEDGIPFPIPGTHKMWLTICYSSQQECQGPNGDWTRFEPGLDVIIY